MSYQSRAQPPPHRTPHCAAASGASLGVLSMVMHQSAQSHACARAMQSSALSACVRTCAYVCVRARLCACESPAQHGGSTLTESLALANYLARWHRWPVAIPRGVIRPRRPVELKHITRSITKGRLLSLSVSCALRRRLLGILFDCDLTNGIASISLPPLSPTNTQTYHELGSRER